MTESQSGLHRLPGESLATQVSKLPNSDREKILSEFTPGELAELEYDWEFWARTEQLAPPGKWLTWLALAGRGFGKALDINTPIPTTDGWKAMGDIVPGDKLFDETGSICSVTAAYEVMTGHICREVKFSDGSSIIADDDHLWVTIDRKTRKALRRRVVNPARQDRPQCVIRYAAAVVRTSDIATTLYDGKEVNHCIPCAGALALPHADLPLDPYLLGCWLGDGTSAGSSITTEDAEILSAFEFGGYTMRRYPHSRAGAASTYGIVSDGVNERCPKSGRMIGNSKSFSHQLRLLGLINNKHVPHVYLRASIEQRLALLQGLFDTDGSFNSSTGSSEYCSINRRLADGVQEIAVSLGFKAVIYCGRATLNGRDCGEKYRVCFTAHNDTPIFRLPRKFATQPKRGRQANRAYRRYIVAAAQVASVPVRCIAVDSPSRLFLAGRAMIPTHNTEAGAQWVRQRVAAGEKNIALIAETQKDLEEVMVARLLAIYPPREAPSVRYRPVRIRWPNGAVALGYNGTEPNQLRGPEFGSAWVDELAKYRYARDTWDMLQFTMRAGNDPRVFVTTTPKPIAVLKEIIKDPNTVVTRGSTFDNSSNLPAQFLDKLKTRYAGTRLGRQELGAEMLEDVPGALWSRLKIDNNRVVMAPVEMARIVVAIDPATTSGEKSDETGIIVAGKDKQGRGYVLEDLTCKESPDAWARIAVDAFHRWKADRIVAETNQGGDMVENTIRTVASMVPFTGIHAKRGKVLRAEPVAALYEQNRISHVGQFADLEDQMSEFTADFDTKSAGYSPDRVDALVYALTELMIEPEARPTRSRTFNIMAR